MRAPVVTLGLLLSLAVPALLVSAASAGEASHVLEWDLGYLTPVGVDFGVSWGPVHLVEAYGQIGIIAFDSDTGYDDTNPSALKLGGFFTSSFSLRLRHTWDEDDRGRWRRKAFAGVAYRDYAGVGGGDALECLYCSDWSREAAYPLNVYLEGGVRVNRVLATLSMRLTDKRGEGEWWGYDPYGVGPTWGEEWDDMRTPAAILQVALTGGLRL